MTTTQAEVLPFESGDDTSAMPVLKLRRGGSAIAQWALGPDDHGLSITVGSDPACDWPISAPGLGPVELRLRFEPDGLFARAEREGLGARVNGVRLENTYVQLEDGARLDLGTACIEVRFIESDARTSRAPSPGSGVRRRPEAPETVEVVGHEPTIVVDPRLFEPSPARTLLEVPAPRTLAPEPAILRHAWADEPVREGDEAPVALLPDAGPMARLTRKALIALALVTVYGVWLTYTEL